MQFQTKYNNLTLCVLTNPIDLYDYTMNNEELF